MALRMPRTGEFSVMAAVAGGLQTYVCFAVLNDIWQEL